MGLDLDRPNSPGRGVFGSSAWLFPATICAVCLLTSLSGDAATDALRFDRQAISVGEIWRLATAHVVHLGWPHTLLNLVGLALVWVLVGRQFGLLSWCAVCLAAMLGVDLGLWFLERQLQWYVGLSGVLHGLLVAGALPGAVRRAPEPLLIIVIVASKLLYEQLVGPLPGSEASAGGPVLVNAHLYGAIAGVAGAGLVWRSVGRGAPI